MHGNEVFQRVRHALAQVEAERNVPRAFRVRERQPGGSPIHQPPRFPPPPRWGFASRDSDYDGRFLYVHRGGGRE